MWGRVGERSCWRGAVLTVGRLWLGAYGTALTVGRLQYGWWGYKGIMPTCNLFNLQQCMYVCIILDFESTNTYKGSYKVAPHTASS